MTSKKRIKQKWLIAVLKEDVTSGHTDMKRKIREYCNNSIVRNFDKMDQFLEKTTITYSGSNR